VSLPFTLDQFFDVFRRYNESVGAGVLLLNGLAVLAVVAALRGGRGPSRVASGILAALWVWMGAVYHLWFFRPINPAAVAFGVIFLVEGILIAWFGLVRGTLRFDSRTGGATFVGLAMGAYALFIYPLIGYAIGHQYPAAPSFGVPCPTTIFTFGLLLLCPAPRLRSVIIIPAAWAVVGGIAAVRLGMWEDLGLVLAAIVATIIFFAQRTEPRAGTIGGTLTPAYDHAD
jgi:hypothetical protein